MSEYLAEAMFQGRPVFYSYAACGAKDAYSSDKALNKSIHKFKDVCKPGCVGKHKKGSGAMPVATLTPLAGLLVLVAAWLN